MLRDNAASISPATGGRRVTAAEAVLSLSGYAWSIVAATVLGLGLRIYLIGTPPLWRDEAFSAVAIRNSVPRILDIVRHDSAPPLVYLLVKTVSVFSNTPGSLRLLSVLAGTAMVPVAAALGRRIAGNRAGILAGAAMAVMPAFVLQSRDLRMYALASSLVLLSVLTLWRAVERPTWERCTLYFACVVLAIYTQYFAVLAVACQLVAAVVVLRPPLRTVLRVGATQALALLALVPWLIAALPQLQHAGAPFWITRLDLRKMEDLFQQFAAGGVYPWSVPSAANLNWLRDIAADGAAIAAIAAILFILRAKAGSRNALGFVALCGLLPTAILLLVSLRRPLFDPRYGAVVWASLVPLVGVGLAWLWHARWIGPVLVAVSLAPLLSYALVAGPNPANDDLRTATAAVAEDAQPGDFIAVDGALDYWVAVYYLPRSMEGQMHLIAPGIHWYDGTAQLKAGTWMKAIPASTTGKIFVIDRVSGKNLPMPPGYTLRDIDCGAGFCGETWQRATPSR